MYSVEELDRINREYRSAKAKYDKAMAEQLEYMKANGLERVDSEDGSVYVKLIRTKETEMPAYTRKASEYLRIF